MAISTVPAKLQLFMQDEKERTIAEALVPQLGFRAVADRQLIGVGAGESVTKFKDGLLTPNDTPVAASTIYSNTDNGMTAAQRGGEQYTLTPQFYDGTLDLRKTDNVIKLIQDYERNIIALARQARLSIDLPAMRTLFSAYMSGNTFTTQAESSSTSIEVDDVTGFETVMVNGVPTAVSGTNVLNVTIDGVANTVTGVTVDGTNTSKAKAFGARSGVLTVGTAVTLSAAGKLVLAADRPKIVRAFASGSERASDLALQAGDLPTLRQIRRAVRELRRNGIPRIGGRYNLYMSDTSMDLLFLDSEFQNLMTGAGVRQIEMAEGVIYEMLDVRLIVNNVISQQDASGSAPLATPTIHRMIMVGADALIEGLFLDVAQMSEWAGGADSLKLHDVKVVDGISFVDRAPIDRLALSLAQSWMVTTGFTCTTDSLITSANFPSATNARYKRAVVLAHSE